MSSPYTNIWLFLGSGIAFILVTLLASRFIRPHRPNPEKNSTYESGEDPVGSPWVPFNFRFYVLAILFLLFEVELLLLFPMTRVYAKPHPEDPAWNYFAWGEMFVFIILLAVGLVYAWGRGFLDWSMAKPKPPETHSPVPRSLYDEFNRQFQRNPNKPTKQ